MKTDTEELLTIREYARIKGVTRQRIEALINGNDVRIKTTKIGPHTFILPSSTYKSEITTNEPKRNKKRN